MRSPCCVHLLVWCLTLSVVATVRAPGQEALLLGSGQGTRSGGVFPDAETQLSTGAAGEQRGDAAGEFLWRLPTGEMIRLQDLLGSPDPAVLDDLRRRVQLQQAIPSWELARMELTGTVKEDVLSLTAELQIRIFRDREWVAVPLAFDELHLRSVEHSGDSAGVQAIPEQSEAGQKRWVFFGSGVHTLRLDLVGKTRPQVPDGRLLTVNLPTATISHATIRFGAPVVIQKLPADAVARTQPGAAAAESVEFWGLPEAFSLSWNEVIPQVARRPMIDSQTRLKLDLTTVPASLSGTQVLQISGSPISEFQVSFPQGFRLQELKATNQAGVSVQSSFESQPAASNSPTTLRLIRPVEGVVNVSFVLDLIDRTFPQDLPVSLPVVLHDNVQQSGDLDILIPQGLLVEELRREGAPRKRVTSLDADTSIAETAYRLRSAESLVMLHVEEYEAQYSVSPEMVFQADTRNIVLTARFSVSVLRGAISDLRFFWAGYEQSAWRILPGSTVLVTDKGAVPLSLAAAADAFRLNFQDRQAGQFQVEFRAFAPLVAEPADQPQLICPEVRTGTSEPLVITTVESDDFSLQPVSADTGQPLAAAPAESQVTIGSPQADRSVRKWIHAPSTAPIRFQLDRRLPSVTTAMTVGLTPRDVGIEVHQEISFRIERRDLSSLSLTVPSGIEPAIRLADESVLLQPAVDETNLWNFPLARARRGDLTVIVDYLWPVADRSSAARRIELPLVSPPALASRVNRCEVGCAAMSGLTVADESAWHPVFSSRFEAAWAVAGAADSVPLVWQPSQISRPADFPEFLVSRTRLATTHFVTDTAAFFVRTPRTCVFQLPPTAGPTSIRINGERLTDAAGLYSERSPDGTRWTLAIARADAPDREPTVVEIQTREPLPREGTLFRSLAVSRPEFQGVEFPVPWIWLVESGDEYRVISQTDRYAGVAGSLSDVLWRPAGAQLPEARIRSIVDPCAREIQEMIRERLETWTSADPQPDVFCAMSDAGPFRGVLVPSVSLLLITAVSSVVFFLLLRLFRYLPVASPILILLIILPTAILVFPDWTLLLLPYTAAGALFALVSAALQRRSGADPLRTQGRGAAGDLLTVFGFSDIPMGSTASGSPDAVLVGNSELGGSATKTLSGN